LRPPNRDIETHLTTCAGTEICFLVKNSSPPKMIFPNYDIWGPPNAYRLGRRHKGGAPGNPLCAHRERIRVQSRTAMARTSSRRAPGHSSSTFWTTCEGGVGSEGGGWRGAQGKVGGAQREGERSPEGGAQGEGGSPSDLTPDWSRKQNPPPHMVRPFAWTCGFPPLLHFSPT